MTTPSNGTGEDNNDADSGAPFEFTDKRRIDPETGEARTPDATPGDASGAGEAGDGEQEDPLAALDFTPDLGEDTALDQARAEAAANLDDLLRERASFTNYRNRTIRDQEAARKRGMEDVLTGLLPVLDDIDRGRQAGELVGPFAAISEKLDGALGKFGIERYGEVGEEFDPNLHEALMHQDSADATTTTVEHVIEYGYRIGERVVRAARVAVVGPEN